MPHNGAPPPRTVASRLAAILLTFRSGSSHSLKEIAALTGLPMSTVHRMTADMASRQLLRRASDGRYEVGPNLQQLAGNTDRVSGLEERATLVVTDLCEATHRRARLGILNAARVCYVEKQWGAEAPTPLRAGATLPAHATAVGKALLAFAPRASVVAVERQLTAYTPRTITEPERLLRQLQLVRLAGFAQSRGELVQGDCAIAVPVFGPGGGVIAAIEVQVQDRHQDFAMCRAALAVSARGLSRELASDCQDQGRHLRVLPSAVDDDLGPRARRLRPHRSGDGSVSRTAISGDPCDTVQLAVRGFSRGT